VETIEDNVHAVAEAFEFFLAFHGAGHIEMKIERHQFERVPLQFAIIADSHDEIQAVDAYAFPMTLFDFVAQPFARNLRPHFFANEGGLLVANPTRFARENENGVAGKRNQDVHIAMNDFETGRVAHGAFESGILIAAHDQGIDLFGFHGRANILVSAVDFFLAGH